MTDDEVLAAAHKIAETRFEVGKIDSLLSAPGNIIRTTSYIEGLGNDDANQFCNEGLRLLRAARIASLRSLIRPQS
jgi:hypothetical protein